MQNNFQPLSAKEQYEIYGGFQVSVAVMIPFIIESVVTLISSLKMLATDNGSFQYHGMKSDWSQNKQAAPKIIKNEIHEAYYPF